MKQRRHIILGSAGFIGKYLTDFLSNQNKDVIEWDIKNDISQDCRVANLHLIKEDIVYFLAWEVGGSKYLNKDNTQMEQRRNNLNLMENVFNQLEESKSHFIFVSSQLASGDTIYGTLKRLGEIWTKQLNGCCLRFWNVYGAYEKLTIRSHVISDFIHQAILDKKIVGATSGEEKRQFIHINDVCKAIQKILDIYSSEICDVTSFEWMKISEVAEIIANYLKVEIVLGKEKGNLQPISTKGKLCNWIPEITFDEGIQKTINLYKNILEK